jgi:hypothetical protein
VNGWTALLPASLILLVAGTYGLGRRYGARVGVSAAALVASSPIVLSQVVHPTVDVLAAALWTLALTAATGTSKRHAITSGGLGGLATAVRLNIAPLDVLVVLFLLFRPERRWHDRTAAALTYVTAGAVAAIAIALMRWHWHGVFGLEPGLWGGLYARSHVPFNLRRCIDLLWHVQTPAMLLLFAAPLLLPGALSMLLAGSVLVSVALYLPSGIFDDWQFLYSVLPSIPPLVILVVASVDAVWRQSRLPRPRVAIAVATVVLAALCVREAYVRGVVR